jgi:hypothetical protein
MQTTGQQTNYHRTDEELKRIFKEVFVEEIRQLFVICQDSTASFSESHRLEHDFIKILIEREKERVSLRQDLKKQVIGWGIIALVGAFGAWVWEQIYHFK